MLYTIYDKGEKIESGVTSARVTEVTGICGSNVSAYVACGHIKAGRYQICMADEEIEPKKLSRFRNEAFTVETAQGWDDTVGMFRKVEWGTNGRKLKVSKRR